MTNNSFWVGVLDSAIFLPNIFSFLLTDLIDRTSKTKLLIILALGQSFSSFGITSIILFNINTPKLLYIVAFISSCFSMNTYTVQDSFMPILVQKENFEKARWIMSITYEIADYLINAVVGFLMQFIKYINLMFSSVFLSLISAFSFAKINKNIVHISLKKDDESQKTILILCLVLNIL